ncbi:unnamed protein product [Moneuplotes crassus]|uniref:Secreted protein n=1 Tax=Euplotes crassus TaxID=5936 RepID=A0AAD1U8G5_EUPCR|nr:unnamed protein product [Moneuplotes crassus]
MNSCAILFCLMLKLLRIICSSTCPLSITTCGHKTINILELSTRIENKSSFFTRRAGNDRWSVFIFIFAFFNT